MPDYKLLISKAAQKQLDKLPDHIADPLINAIHGHRYHPSC